MPEPSAASIQSQLEALVEPQLGVALAFPGHEDGGQLVPFSWDEAAQGELNSLTLLQAEGWCSELTVSEALLAWQQPEQVGAVGGETWLIPAGDPAQILPNPTRPAEHQALDAELLHLLESRLQNLQAIRLSCDPNYALVLLVGQLADAAEPAWIGIAPTVPLATELTTPASPLNLTPLPLVASSTPDDLSMLQLQIQALLTRRGSVRLYGYYGGGYNQTHEYRLVQATGQSQAEALQALMQATGLLQISQFEGFQPSSDAESLQPIERILQPLQPRVYQFSFWDWEQIYVIAELPESAGNWLGVRLRSRFTYNP